MNHDHGKEDTEGSESSSGGGNTAGTLCDVQSLDECIQRREGMVLFWGICRHRGSCGESPVKTPIALSHRGRL